MNLRKVQEGKDQFDKFVNHVLLKQNVLKFNCNNFTKVYDFRGLG